VTCHRAEFKGAYVRRATRPCLSTEFLGLILVGNTNVGPCGKENDRRVQYGNAVSVGVVGGSGLWT